MSKPFKGKVVIHRKVELSPEQKKKADELYGPNLGFYYVVDYQNHPVFRGRDAMGGTTSLVVNERATEEGLHIETLNTQYLGVPFRSH